MVPENRVKVKTCSELRREIANLSGFSLGMSRSFTKDQVNQVLGFLDEERAVPVYDVYSTDSPRLHELKSWLAEAAGVGSYDPGDPDVPRRFRREELVAVRDVLRCKRGFER